MNTVKVRDIEIGAGAPKIIVPIVGVTKNDIIEEAKTFDSIPVDVVEWRVDWFEGVFDFAQVEDVLKDLRAALGNTPILMTFRTSKEGGEKAIEPEAYAELNIKAAQTGYVDLIDVEIFTGDEIVKKIIDGAHAAGVKVVASNHDFFKTPAKADIIYRLRKMQDMNAAPGVATMGIKFFIAIAQMLLPFVLGVAVTSTAAGLTSYNPLFYGCGIAYIVLFVLVFLFPLPDADQKASGKKEGLIDSLKHTHFSFESIAMILIGFTCTGTFQLWLNCAQNFAKENVGWADPSIMQTYYSAGTMLALIVTAFLTRKIKDVRFIVVYPAICLVTMIAVLMGQSKPLMIAGAFIIGWAGAGGLLQIATSVCNMLFPKIKGTVTALVMIASSLCNYTILTAASKMQPSGVMTMNIVLTAVGVALGLFVNIRYKKMVELAEQDN